MEKIDHFAVQAVGVPFKAGGADFRGWSCWGMLRAAYRECFGLELPDLEDCRLQGPEEVRPALDALALAYREIPPGQERPGDVLLLRGHPCHAAMVVALGLMLHVDRGCATCIEPYLSGVWKPRVLGIYRYEQLTAD